ncbi:D-alanine--D-alanine ligase A [Aquicella siphonis]|uniref:D-alanine--D-alanine ligase n=1 Tax=Aquicella siphonis TaxID=254247 RepID=A0A5E4PKT9_9COXI|nr:D-alanine--D-alanine ligase family protein [Aquicella siphonis]VVC76943.1 D-alanine--D-alanine ligase A [Aquicella siphonis]
MKQSDKIRVAVLYGGRSAEHEVSLRSAANVIQYLDTSRFEVIPIGIDKQGNWFLGKEVFANSLEHNRVSRLHDNSQTWFAPEWIGNPAEGHQSRELIAKGGLSGPHFDVVFPVVHGTLCEDGTLQGLLEIAGLPYVGCGVLSSSVGMDKDVSKRLAMHAGINVAPYIMIKQDQWQFNQDHYVREVSDKLSYPVFVKPANTGSSIGITKVKSQDQLSAAVEEAFRFDTKVLVEKALNVMELEVAVLESLDRSADPIVSVVGEVRPTHEFYSYDAKYMDENGAELLIPAPVSGAVREQAQTVARKLFQALECEGMARVDLFLDKHSQQIYFNEINTIPGFTQISMYPKLMEATGISYQDLLTHLIQLAIKRHQNKSRLKRSYAG